MKKFAVSGLRRFFASTVRYIEKEGGEDVSLRKGIYQGSEL